MKILLLILAAGGVYAQPLVGDRPDFTEAAEAVGRNILQIELGYTATHDGDWAHSLGEPLLRAGVLADWLELRLGRTEDIYLGMKLALTPGIAVIPQITLPTSPGVNLVYSWDLTDRVSLAGSSQVNRGTGWAQSIAVGMKVSAPVGLYAEWYRETEHYINGGLTWLLAENLQWDIRAGFGLNDDMFTGTGIVLRIP